MEIPGKETYPLREMPKSAQTVSALPSSTYVSYLQIPLSKGIFSVGHNQEEILPNYSDVIQSKIWCIRDGAKGVTNYSCALE